MGHGEGVNIAVGLPVVRTSVDHGTGLGIAGTGRADERRMLEAMRQAVALAPRRAAVAARAYRPLALRIPHHASRAGATACNASAAALFAPARMGRRGASLKPNRRCEP